MLSVELLQNLGDIRGARYDFEKAGDVLPKHVHTENDVHITIVARGRLKAYSHDWEVEAMAGQIIDFRPGEPHELMALEDNTRIFNIVKKHGGVVRVMTEAEFSAERRAEMYARPHYPSWVFNEAAVRWEAPSPCPQDGNPYTWDEATTSWKAIEVASV